MQHDSRAKTFAESIPQSDRVAYGRTVRRRTRPDLDGGDAISGIHDQLPRQSRSRNPRPPLWATFDLWAPLAEGAG